MGILKEKSVGQNGRGKITGLLIFAAAIIIAAALIFWRTPVAARLGYVPAQYKLGVQAYERGEKRENFCQK